MKAADKRPPAQDTMLGHITGYWVSQLVYVAARLGIADELAGGPRTTAALAKKVGAHEPYLRRVLRALASLGIFAETANGRFRLTPLGATLRSDVKGSLRPFALMIVDTYNWNPWGDLLHGIAHGSSSRSTTSSASRSSITCAGTATPTANSPHRWPASPDRRTTPSPAPWISDASRRWWTSAARTDICSPPCWVAIGGCAAFCTTSHRSSPAPAPADSSRAPTVAARCSVQGGDFFTSVPTGADAYMMKYIMHDWTDDQCARILGHCRRAMAPDGRVLVVEHVIRPGNGADWGKMLDINMLVLTGGQERTKEEFAALFARVGLRLKRVHRTASALSVLEAAPV